MALAVLGAAVLVLKSGYHGPFEDVLNAYAGNVAVSFALYFAAINATSSYGLAVIVDIATGRVLRRRHERGRPEIGGG